jgi:hypothetical protein
VNIIQARILEADKKKTDTRPRIRFLCAEWDSDNQRGTLLDKEKCPYEVISADLDKECIGFLDAGEYVSGVVDGTRVSQILIETGPRAISVLHERAEFESQGATDRTSSWRSQGTPDTGLRGGRPDSGRFSHRGPEHGKN